MRQWIGLAAKRRKRRKKSDVAQRVFTDFEFGCATVQGKRSFPHAITEEEDIIFHEVSSFLRLLRLFAAK
jgi:hypothetical protein